MPEISESCPWHGHFPDGTIPDLTLQPRRVSAILEEAALTYPKRTAVCFQNYRLTYAQLHEKAERFAGALRAYGVGLGDRVAVMLPNLPQTVIAFWGIMKAGATVVMTNPLYREAELTRHLLDAKADVLITLDMLWPHLEPLLERLQIRLTVITTIADGLRFPLTWALAFRAWRDGAPSISWSESIVRWRDFCSGASRFSAPEGNPHAEIALLQYTGGTTGEAKGAMLTHANLTAQLTQLLSLFHCQEQEEHRFLALMPFFHVFGLMGNIVMPAALAAMTIPIPRYTPADLLQSIDRHKPTFFVGAPSIYIALLQQKSLAKYDLTCIRYCISGSAPFPAEMLRRWKEVTKAAITEGFGLTEASPVLCANPLHGVQKIGSIGIPLPLTELRIVDLDTGESTLGDNESGELVARGPQVMAGYWNRPEENARTLRNGWLYTGDVAYRDEDGYYFLVDRKKDLVIVGGYNVYPREVEEVLYEHPSVAEAVCIGVAHPTRGETLKAYIVPKAGERPTKAELSSHCRIRLANYKVPRFFELRESLPKTLVGKVLRRALQEENNQQEHAANAVEKEM